MVFRRSQRVVDRVLQAGADQQVAELLLGLDDFVAVLRRQRVLQQRDRHIFVADDARHFLDQVGGQVHVQPVPGDDALQQRLAGLAVQAKGGDGGGIGGGGGDLAHVEVEPAQCVRHLVERHAHAEDAARVAGGGVDCHRALRRRVGIGNAGHDAPACVEPH